MRVPQTKQPSPPSVFQKSERNKLIIMSVLLVVVLIAFLTSQMQEKKLEGQEMGKVGAEPDPVVTVAIDDFDVTPLEGKFNDNLEKNRVLLTQELLDPFFLYSVGFGDAHWKALGTKELDEEALTALQSDPSAHRGAAYRIRGTLEDVKSRERQDGLTEYKGWLRLADGQLVHFVLSDFFDAVDLGDYIRIDGLFVKLYRREVHDGSMEEGPLFVGSRTTRSFPLCAPHDPSILAAKLALVADDTPTTSTGMGRSVFDAQWELMNYAASPAGAEIDWEGAHELDNLTMTDVLKNGKDYRGEPFRIPISQSMDIYTESGGENPLRLDQVTLGWLGNTTWVNQAGVIKFILPGGHSELESAKLVVGRGFFLKNHNYQPRDGGVRQAPYFVMTSVEEFIPVESTVARDILLAVAGLALVLLIIFPLLLLRDKRKSEALQRDLVRRRQERRRKQAEQAAVAEQSPQ